MVQSHFALGRFQTLLDRPAPPSHGDERLEQRARGCEGEIVGKLLRVSAGVWGRPRAADQQRLLKARLLGRHQSDEGPVVQARALRPVARAELPPLLRCYRVQGNLLGGQVIVGRPPGQVDAVVAGDGQYIGLPARLQPVPQGAAAPIDGVARYPRRWQLGGRQPHEHAPG